MNGEEEKSDLGYWIDLLNSSNGYASAFNRRNPDKATVERHTANEWSRSMLAEFGIDLGQALPEPHNPPDAFFAWDGRRIGVELTELLEQGHKQRSVEPNKGRIESHNRGQLFLDSQWNADRFRAEVQRRIDAKGDKYAAADLTIDVLVIHTAEPWLLSHDARRWLAHGLFRSHPNIGNAFLLFWYEAGGADHWPLLRLYGDMGA